AQVLAAEKQVYLMPGAVVFRYEREKNDNIAVIINPQGEVEYRYEKSVSWYPTDSDGIVPVIETPYGRLAAAICFDMDYPALIHQARSADIILVPAMDTKEIADFHTQVAVARGIENGFSVIRQSNLGASIAADYLGRPLA
ncbi:MAG: carbon-nitrogen hydrolase family protein, partial [Bacillota bacterium]